MRSLKQFIASQQSILQGHRLLEIIRTTRSLELLAAVARALGWWPLLFQDVLRLNVEKVSGSGYERIARYHQAEDSGHDRLFLDDLRVLSVEPPRIDELFNDSFRPLRDACYSLLAEVQRDQSDIQRIALLLALESTGHIFFEGTSAAVERICPELPLRYFARFHLSLEKNHDLFADTTNVELERVELDDEAYAQCEAMILRIYRTWNNIFTYLADRMVEGLGSVSNVSRFDKPSNAIAGGVQHADGA